MNQRDLFSALVMVGICFAILSGAIASPVRTLGRTVVVQDGGYFPQAVRLRSGELLLAVRGGAPHLGIGGRLDLLRSTDNGRTWSERQTVVDSPLDDRNPALGQLAEPGPFGTVALAYHVYTDYPEVSEADRAEKTGLWVTLSRDRGNTWTAPKKVDTTALGGWASPYGKILQLPDGIALLSVYTAEAAYVLRSRDNGETWGEPSRIARGYNEAALARLPNGTLIAALRNYGGPERTSIAFSRDAGRTWTEPAAVTEGGEYPADLTVLRNGHLLLTYGLRTEGLRGVAGLLSYDGGRTWDREGRFLLSDDAISSDCGYPTTLQLPDASLLTIHYQIDSRSNRDLGAHAAATFYREASAEAESPFGSCHLDGDISLRAQAGVRWLRLDFVLGSLASAANETQRAERWAHWDGEIARCEANGINVLGILVHYYPGGRAPASDEERANYAGMCEQVAARYKGRVHYWEIWNEPNLGQFWPPRANPEDYAQVLKVGYAAVKRGNPEAQVLGMSTLGIDLPFIERVLQQGTADCYDILAVHPYRDLRDIDVNNDLPDMTMAYDIEEARRLMARYGSVKPIWITEMGRNTAWTPEGNGVSEEEHANYTARMFVLALAAGVEKVFQYHFRQGGDDPVYTEMHYGLLRADGSPKPAFFAFSTLTRKLEGLRFGGNVLSEDRRARGYLFAGPTRAALVLWAVEGHTTVSLPVGVERLTLTDREGREHTLYAPERVVRLTLTESPVYLEGFDRESAAALAALRLSLPWLQAEAGKPYRLLARISNPTGEPLEWALTGASCAGTAIPTSGLRGTLQPGGAQDFELPFAVPARTPPGSTRTVECRFDLGTHRGLRKTIQAPVQPGWLICGPFPNPKREPQRKTPDWGPQVQDTGFDVDYLADRGGEARIEPQAGWTHLSESVEGKVVRWQPYALDQREFLDFRHTLSPNKRVVAYAFAYLWSDRERPAVLRVGSDDGIKIWLNHRLVHSNHMHREAHLGQDLITVHLKKGRNPLLVKVDQAQYGWGFYLQVTD